MDSKFEQIAFTWYDHILFILMLLVCASIGIYFSFTSAKKKKKEITEEYFMGGKKMKVLPISLSLIASHISSISLMSVPADVYTFGAMYWLSTISIFMVAIATSYIYLPIFYKLELSSAYEYLQLRFDTSIRSVCSFTYVTTCILFMAVAIYVPALAYSQATGINIVYVIPLICGVCIFYTAMGGLKAVVWTDTIQFSVTITSVVIVYYLGLRQAGGLTAVFASAYEGDRLDLDFGIDLTKRETVLPVLTYWFLSYLRMCGMGQECILKFMSLPTLRAAKQSIFLFCFGIIAVKCVIVIIGLTMYKLYHDCDPLQAGFIGAIDKLMPFHVAKVASHIPGLTGLFISGVFCTALSILSALMNAISATLYEDFVAKNFDTDGKRTKLIIKLLVIIVGIVIILLAILVEYLGPILPLAISISSLGIGAFIGLFTLGIMCPRANTKGALWGMIASLSIVTWMFVGAQWHKTKGSVHHVAQHLSVDHCPFEVATMSPVWNSTAPSQEQVFFLYRITHYYYASIGTLVCLVVGYVVSCLFPEKDRVIEKRFFAPLVHFMIKEPSAKDEYHSIENASKLIEMSSINLPN